MGWVCVSRSASFCALYCDLCCSVAHSCVSFRALCRVVFSGLFWVCCFVHCVFARTFFALLRWVVFCLAAFGMCYVVLCVAYCFCVRLVVCFVWCFLSVVCVVVCVVACVVVCVVVSVVV